MNLLNQIVKSKIFGAGTVIQQGDTSITVKFAGKESKFQYPEAFRKFLTAENADIQQMLLAEIAEADAALVEEKKQKAQVQQEAEQVRRNELTRKANRSHSRSRKLVKRMERVDGQQLTFLVFQGSMFDKECEGGYIWTSKYNRSGDLCHPWERMAEIHKGDVILHCVEGSVKAISVAEGACTDAVNPEKLIEKSLDSEGRMVKCSYTKIQKPIQHADYKDTIIKYCNVKYAPFDKDGNGNTGYLYELNRTLAKFLVEKSVMDNSYLLDLACVQELLER